MRMTAVAGVGGGDAAAIARTVAAVAPVAEAWSASKVIRWSPTMTYSSPQAASGRAGQLRLRADEWVLARA